ncbi:hypothetical protein SEA_SALLYK_67 [Microbacterium phage SallyK]|nr:hypothetical protein SEA_STRAWBERRYJAMM_70 [Microbacterium phage StrawberryJamm]UJD20796.1 hypothetical protein SEA_ALUMINUMJESUS_61 [Microbacterium phage AluminumJesus]UVG34433.1 hypothetical protein SEA_GAZEBO_64 [Microbacterium phage Gazebo]WKW84933.1 hypothetical protein SEA_SALLYK_67 [Microbacterium phage SallyK]
MAALIVRGVRDLVRAVERLADEQHTANLIAWSTANGTEPTPALTTEITARLEQ